VALRRSGEHRAENRAGRRAGDRQRRFTAAADRASSRDFSDADVAEKKISFEDMRGNPFTKPVWQIVLHVVNHGTHHRGQVSGFLRAMGHTRPPLDLMEYYMTL
jgi:uncharacterized damage-inducible protein DinB